MSDQELALKAVELAVSARKSHHDVQDILMNAQQIFLFSRQPYPTHEDSNEVRIYT